MAALNLKAWWAVAGVFAGCCSNVIFLELLVKNDPGSGMLITFSQFLFISIEGYIFTSRWGTVKRIIAFSDYVAIVLMFFITNVCNNYVFDFNIPMPLHMIFRSGSLMVSMIMGIVILKRRYTFSKYLAVILITIGVILCTVISGSKVQDNSKVAANLESEQEVVKTEVVQRENGVAAVVWWSLGIFILTIALVVSACMGIYQEAIYKKYGKHSREVLYYTHMLPLPGFVFLSANIWQHILIAVQSPPLLVAGVYQTFIPEQVAYLICNTITQYMCISSVYVLTAECTSLTVTLVLTLRKFLSLLVSVVYFKNEFTIYHWMGTMLVFIGTAIFTEVLPCSMSFLRLRSTSKHPTRKDASLAEEWKDTLSNGGKLKAT